MDIRKVLKSAYTTLIQEVSCRQHSQGVGAPSSFSCVCSLSNDGVASTVAEAAALKRWSGSLKASSAEHSTPASAIAELSAGSQSEQQLHNLTVGKRARGGRLAGPPAEPRGTDDMMVGHLLNADHQIIHVLCQSLGNSTTS
eukprot:6203465-Pleurochrysis_carterae.AAC.1